MLAQLTRHVGVQRDQSVECHPQVIGRQLQLIKHVLHRQVVYVLAVEVNETGVDQEAFLEDFELKQLWQFLVERSLASHLLNQCFFHEAAADHKN